MAALTGLTNPFPAVITHTPVVPRPGRGTRSLGLGQRRGEQGEDKRGFHTLDHNSLPHHSMAPPRSHYSAPNSPEGRRCSGAHRHSATPREEWDEENHTGELMGEWLSGLPPTMPFHRGQVLIIPQSPYQQKLGASKSPRKGATTPRLGSKARTDMVQLETDDNNDHTRRDATLGGRRDESTSKKAGAGAEGAAED